MALIYDYQAHVDNSYLSTQIKTELNSLFKKNLGKTISKGRISSQMLGLKTQRMRAICLVAALTILQNKGGFMIQSLFALKEKHIHFLLTYWVGEGHARGSIENKLTYLGALAQWIGKGNLIKDSSQYPQLADLPHRSGTTHIDKSWDAIGVDAHQKIALIAQENTNIAIQLALQITFGLRTEESMLLRPHDVVMRRANQVYLMISHGTKGGRSRRIEVKDEADLAVIDLAQEFINKKSRTTIPDEYSLREWQNKYYYLLKKHGFTKKELGVTAHGLRHQYLQNLYEKLTGHVSPVRGGDQPAPDVLAHASQIITEHAGHSRLSKANAYIGNHAAIKAKTSKDLTNDQILQRLQECGGNKMKAAELLNCSRSYLYLRLKKMEQHAN